MGDLLLPSSGSATEARLQNLHHALTLFSALSSLPENQFVTQLQPGDCVVFDNRRVLHARTAFEFVERGGEGGEGGGSEEGGERGRWLKGSYLEGDAVRSRIRVLRRRLGSGEEE